MGIGRATASFGVLIAIAGQAPLLAQTFTDSPAPRALHAPFVANDGQAHESVAFYAAMQGGTVAVDRSGELIYALATDDSSLVLTERLVGARVRSPRGDGLSPATINIYRGRDPTKWRHGVRAYDAVHLGDVYDGIEARVRAIGATVEKIFVVAPGARPDRIRIRLRGADRLAVSSTGALEARTTHGDVRFSKPIAYQEVNGRKIVVKASYTVRGDEYGFRIGRYDRGRELVIDPILAATFIGSAGFDDVFAIASDGAGGVYVAGTTRFLLPFPGITPGSADPIYGGDTNTTEAFVARLDAGLTTLLSATYIGGGSWETVYALAVDAAGTVFVAGRTDSSDFPGVGPGSADSTFAGTSEAFVARLDPTLSVLQVATYLGGDSIDGALALDIDAAGMLYVGGNTHSSNFPGVTVASSDPTFSGVRDGFVARLDPSLIVPPVATYVSGTGCDSVSAVAVDGSGVYVAGTTQSSDFPGISLASADFSFSGTDAYVVRLDPMLTLPPVATYVGGTEDGGASSLALGNGSVYVAGLTASTDFPGVGPGSADSDQHDLEGFIARLTPDLGSVMAATLLGGETWDWVNDIAIGVLGTVVVAGGTRSGFAFPTPGGWAAGCNGSVSREDAMFGTVSSDLSTVSSLMCVRHSDALGLAVDGPSIFIGGTTSSDTWLHPDQVEPTAADPEFGGQREGFVVRLGSPFFSVTWSQLLAALKESLMLCRCLNGRDERALVRTLDKAGEQFTRDNHHAAIAALNQVVRVIERLVRSGDMSVDDGRRFIAQANEIIGAMRPVPSRAPVRPRDIRSIPRVFAESCACDTFVRASGAEGGFSGGPISCPALPPRGAEPRR